MHLSTFFVYRVSAAYCGLLMQVLLSKIEEIDTFKATNLHQNKVKTYPKRYYNHNLLYKIYQEL